MVGFEEQYCKVLLGELEVDEHTKARAFNYCTQQYRGMKPIVDGFPSLKGDYDKYRIALITHNIRSKSI